MYTICTCNFFFICVNHFLLIKKFLKASNTTYIFLRMFFFFAKGMQKNPQNYIIAIVTRNTSRLWSKSMLSPFYLSTLETWQSKKHKSSKQSKVKFGKSRYLHSFCILTKNKKNLKSYLLYLRLLIFSYSKMKMKPTCFFYQSHFCYLPTQSYFSAAFNLIVLS